MPATAQPIETMLDSPAEISSKPPATSERTKPATAGPLSGTGGWP